jgi:predicted ribosomally synthesized peptide with SipW-like signal peptide
MNISRIVLALLLIVGAGGALAGGTSAFFSDTETSTGNTFTAGAFDLKIDNESYYNRNKCTEVTAGVWQWQGQAAFPVPGTPCETSFPASNLDEGKLFFNFTDIKPDDEGEDTISIHVENDAYMCMDLVLTSDDDKSSTEPELAAPDAQEDANNTWDGELADSLQFFWWADDGDNVYEEGENAISEGVQTLTDLATTSGSFTVTLADATGNVWGGLNPIPGGQTVYIAKAWCFGTLTLNPVESGEGVNPQVASGVQCDGSALGNGTQTDSATLDIQFRAEQARNNRRFQCQDDDRPVGTLTIIKVVTNDNGGNNIVNDFQLFADNGVTEFPMTSSIPNNLLPGTYTVTETGVSGYVASFSGDCDVNGQVTLAANENKVCTITNNDLPAVITLVKNVTGTPPLAGANTFGLSVDGFFINNNTSTSTASNVPHVLNEAGRVGYSFVSMSGVSSGGKSCPAVLGGSVTLDEGESIICTITNNKN